MVTELKSENYDPDEKITANKKKEWKNENYKIEKDLNERQVNCFGCFVGSCTFRKDVSSKEDPKNSSNTKTNFFKKSKYTRYSFYRNNLAFFLTILVYILIQIILVIIQLNIYYDVNIYVKFARAGGILLDFNSCLIILLVLRRLTTWTRNSFIGRSYLPLDEFLNFHKLIGYFIVILSLIHTIAHCLNLYTLSSEYKNTHRKHQHTSFVSQIISSFSLLVNNKTDINLKYDANYTYENTNSSKTAESNLLNEDDSELKFAELAFTTKSQIGWVASLAMPTGWALWVVLIIIVIFALPFIRKKGHFQVFYLTHWFHIVYYMLLIIHAKNFWKWFLFPFVLVVLERIFTCFRVKSDKYGDTFIKEVTHLILTRPSDFKFKSGDYLFINIPSIARYEWHPFTISSAPELKDEIWLHIRSLGNWTNKLYDYFNNYSKSQLALQTNDFKETKSAIKYKKKVSNYVVMVDYKKNLTERQFGEPNVPNQRKENNNKVKSSDFNTKEIQMNLNISNKLENLWMSVSIDGPYGTASRRIFDSEHAVLIAGGIGVTPFASILQNLWFKYSKSLKTCAKCNHKWYDQVEQKKLKKVDFIWVNRDYQSFEWFIELLGQLELQQLQTLPNERFLDIHLYMTSSVNCQEIKTFDLESETERKGNTNDKVKNFSLKLNPGRPNFDSLFTNISNNKKGSKVDVFFCGNSEFGRIVQKNSIRYKFKYFKEYF